MISVNGFTPEDAVERWLQVLRDPKSKKAYRKLEDAEDNNKRCIIGHLCHAVRLFRQQKEDRVFYGSDFQHAGTPVELVDLFYNEDTEFHDFEVPIQVGRRKIQVLEVLNDNTNLQLPELADIIEHQWKNRNLWPEAERDE